MKYEQYQNIKLKDGRDGIIVEILSPTDFIVDVGNSPEDWETIFVKAEEAAESITKQGKVINILNDEYGMAKSKEGAQSGTI